MNSFPMRLRASSSRLAMALAGLLAAATVGAAPALPTSSADSGHAAQAGLSTVIAANAPDNAVTGSMTWNYLNIVGAAFQGRNDGVGFAGGSAGCLYTNAGNRRLTAKALLPDGALVKYVRAYYYDTSASDMTVWLTGYSGDGTNNDLIMVASEGTGGFGSTLSAEMNYTVDHYTSALALVATPSVLDATQQFCGVRIAYYTAEQLDTIFKNGFD